MRAARLRTILVTAIGVGLTASVSYAQCLRYSVQIASGMPCGIGHGAASPYGLNNNGVVAGASWTCGETGFPFMWSNGPNVMLISIPGAINAGATGINSAMQIIGIKEGSTGHVGFLYQNGVSVDIGSFGTNFSEPYAINERGAIVGMYAGNRAFIWKDGIMTQLTVPHGPSAIANDINDQGDIVGWMGVDPSPFFGAQACVWHERKATALNLPSEAVSSTALGINNSGQVCGWMFVPNPSGSGYLERSFFWSNGAAKDIGILPGAARSVARDINVQGQIVGYSELVGGGNVAFIWDNGIIQNLNSLVPANLGVFLDDARGINNNGQIACLGRDQNNDYVSVLLTPIPPVAGDVTCDWRVDHLDLLQVIFAWGECPAPVPPLDSQCPADFNHDGRVNVQDLLFVINHWSAN